MKLVRSNGSELTVRDTGPVVFRLRASPGAPLPLLDEVMEEEEARIILRTLLASRRYEGGKV